MAAIQRRDEPGGNRILAVAPLTQCPGRNGQVVGSRISCDHDAAILSNGDGGYRRVSEHTETATASIARDFARSEVCRIMSNKRAGFHPEKRSVRNA